MTEYEPDISVDENEENLWTVTFRTNSYAGNFERDFTAYVTGQIGDCGVGDQYADTFKEEEGEDVYHDIADIICQMPDDNDTYRPCAMAENDEGDWYDVEIYFSDRPGDEIIALMKRRAKAFEDYSPNLNLLSKERLFVEDKIKLTNDFTQTMTTVSTHTTVEEL